MRAFGIVLLSLLSACSRRAESHARAIEMPTARGGGPTVEAPVDGDARARIAHAQCAVRAACGDAEAADVCRTRIEGELTFRCAVDLARLDLCVERIRARTCAESRATPPANECAESQLCAKE